MFRINLNILFLSTKMFCFMRMNDGDLMVYSFQNENIIYTVVSQNYSKMKAHFSRIWELWWLYLRPSHSRNSCWLGLVENIYKLCLYIYELDLTSSSFITFATDRGGRKIRILKLTFCPGTLQHQISSYVNSKLAYLPLHFCFQTNFALSFWQMFYFLYLGNKWANICLPNH